MSSIIKFFAISTLLLGASFYLYVSNIKRVNLPDHVLGHPVYYFEDLIDDGTYEHLNRYTRELGADHQGFQSNLNLLSVIQSTIGDREPVNEDGQCDSLLMYLDPKGEYCRMHSRMDMI